MKMHMILWYENAHIRLYLDLSLHHTCWCVCCLIVVCVTCCCTTCTSRGVVNALSRSVCPLEVSLSLSPSDLAHWLDLTLHSTNKRFRCFSECSCWTWYNLAWRCSTSVSLSASPTTRLIFCCLYLSFFQCFFFSLSNDLCCGCVHNGHPI